MFVVRDALRRILPKRLTIGHKMTAVCLVFALPFSFLYSSWLGQKNEARATAEKEARGLQYLGPIRQAIHLVFEHEALTVRLAKGETVSSSNYNGIPERLNEALASLSATRSAEQSPDLATDALEEQFKTLRTKWSALRADLPNLSPEECVQAHRALLAQLESLLRLVASSHGLAQDSDPRIRSLYAAMSVLQEPETGMRKSTWDKTLEECDQSLQARIKEIRSAKLYGLIIVTGCTFLAALLAWWFASSLSRQVDSITEMFQQLAMGRLDARACVITSDQLGRLADDLNDSFLPFIRREERGNASASMQQLLEETSAIENGDLSRRVSVNGALTGAVADSFNYLSEELCNLIGEVQKETENAKTSIKRIQGKLNESVQAGESGNRHLSTAGKSLEALATATQSMGTIATESSSIGMQAQAHAGTSKLALTSALEGLSKVRNQMRDAAKSIVRMQEGLRRMNAQQESLDDAVEQTNILAWNAAIQAAHTGDDRHPLFDFADKAQQVAETSGNIAKKLSEQFKAIQSDAQETVANAAANAQELLAGYQQLTQAAEGIAQFESALKQVREHAQALGNGIGKQAASGEQLDESLQAVSESYAGISNASGEAIRALGAVEIRLEKLRKNVSRYRLPDAEAKSKDNDEPRMATRSGQQDFASISPEMAAIELALQR